MPDVVIHHCRVRVLRRRGWSWGPAPRELVNEIIRRLPQVIAAHLANYSEDGDIEITDPVRVTIPVRLNASGILQTFDVGANSAPPTSASMQIARPHAHKAPPVSVSHPAPAAPTMLSPSDEIAAANRGASEASALARLLQRWRRHGCLGRLLHCVPIHIRATWEGNLSAPASIVTESVQLHHAPVDEAIGAILAKLGGPPNSPDLCVLYRLVLAVEVAAALDRPIDDIQIWHAIERLVPVEIQSERQQIETVVPTTQALAASNSGSQALPGAGEADWKLSPSTAGSIHARRRETTHITRLAQAQERPRTWQAQVDCALPFLMLGPLVDIGFFDAVAATLETEGLETAWPAFAAALAYKTLGVADAYGRRSASIQRDGAAFAGSRDSISEIAITELAERTIARLAAPQAVLAHAMLEGHLPGQPVLLRRLDDHPGYLLVEPVGAIPIVVGENLDALRQWFSLFENELMLVPRAASDPPLLRSLQQSAIRFITDAPPTRTETWRCIRLRHDRWWTNDAVTAAPALIRHVRHMADADEQAADVWRTFTTERPSAPLTPHSDLDHVLANAAALALGKIAWTLWHEREPVDPVLTLTRFASLSARVQFDEERVRVTLPMGRRSWDLSEHRLLDDVPNLPWLEGRTVVFHVG